jgi:hypothetical protein
MNSEIYVRFADINLSLLGFFLDIEIQYEGFSIQVLKQKTASQEIISFLKGYFYTNSFVSKKDYLYC